MLFSLANMAAHIHCLLRFVSLLWRLAAGSSPAGSRGGRRSNSRRSAADTKGFLQHFGGEDSAAVNDGGYGLGRPGSPQRTVFSKQPAGPRSSGGGSVASRLGVSSADSGEGSAGSAGGSASRITRLSLAQLRAAYPFYPMWLVKPFPLCLPASLCTAIGSCHQPVSCSSVKHWDCSSAPPPHSAALCSWQAYAAIAIAAWAASAAFHARDVKITERTDYLLADALVLFGLLVAAARALGCASRRFAAFATVSCVSQ